MLDFQRSPSPSSFILLSLSHLPPQLDVRAATTARCRPDHWGTTQSRAWACVETWKKHSFRLKEEVRLKERLSGRETALMMLKIGPWLWYTPQVNHCYSLLSTYLSPCPPILPLQHCSSISRRAPPASPLAPTTHPDSTSFTTTYSKLPSSSHARSVAINNWSHVSARISRLWILSEAIFFSPCARPDVPSNCADLLTYRAPLRCLSASTSSLHFEICLALSPLAAAFTNYFVDWGCAHKSSRELIKCDALPEFKTRQHDRGGNLLAHAASKIYLF